MTWTLVDDGTTIAIEAHARDGAIRIPAEALERSLGWKLQDEGLCRAGTCVPVSDRAALVGDDGVDVGAFARLLDRPLAVDVDERVVVFGTSANERATRLAAMEAPDFTLPDLAGRLHSLRDQRGKKTLLVAWASW
jgi:hypothetical protein